MYASYIFNVAHHYYRKKFNEFGNSTMMKILREIREKVLALNAIEA